MLFKLNHEKIVTVRSRGGYDTFTAKITDNTIIIKIAESNFFTICSNMLIYHKQSPFHRLGAFLCL